MDNRKELKEMEKVEGGRTAEPPQMVLAHCGVAYPASYACDRRGEYEKYCTGCPLRGTTEYVSGT